MPDKVKVEITIQGNTYKIVSDDSKSYVQYVAEYVDDRMDNFAKNNKNKSITDVAILTTLNIADEYIKLQREFEILNERRAEFELRSEVVIGDEEDVDQSELNEYNKLLGQFKRVVEETSRYQDEIEQLREKLQLLSYELERKEKELGASKIKVNKLEEQMISHGHSNRSSMNFSDEG